MANETTQTGTQTQAPQHLHYHPNGTFYWTGGFETKDVVKAAGFLWHGGDRCRPGCRACEAQIGKRWWTIYKEKAVRLAQYADADAAKMLAATEQAIEASHATDNREIDIPVPAGLAYLPYQRGGIAYAMARESTLVGDEMGLGKTIQALGLINADSTIRNVLIVCPASLRLNWRREAEKWLVRSFRIHVVEAAGAAPADAEIVILNDERLKGAHGKALLDSLMARSWDLLVVDEAHRLKDPRTQRAEILLGFEDRKTGTRTPGLADRARRKLFLTGTPLPNRVKELWPLVHAAAPIEFGNFFSFAKRYCDAHQEQVGHGRWAKMVWNFDGSSHLDELQTRLRASCMVRRLKRDVLTELPPKRRQVVILPTNGAARAVAAEREAWEAQEEMLTTLRAEVELAAASGDEAAYRSAVGALDAAGKVAFEEISARRHEVELAKVDAVVEHVNDVLDTLETRKVVVFGWHKDAIAATVAGLGAERCRVITGDTPMEDRQAAVDAFQTDAGVEVIIGTIGAMGVGLTLTASCTVLFQSLSWVPSDVSQAEDRCHRIGQKASVNVQHLVLDGSLDARMAQVIVEKQDVADRALDLSPAELRIPAVPAGRADRTAAESNIHPRKYPVPTPEQRAMAARGIQTLAGMCDGAVAEDTVGFNKIDTHIGHSLAQRAASRALSDGETWLAAKLCQRYRRQLGGKDAIAPLEDLLRAKAEVK